MFVLGSADPEAAEIRGIAESKGVRVLQAVDDDGAPVRGGGAYSASRERTLVGIRRWRRLVLVECAFAGDDNPPDTLRIDHHRPGDPGFGKPPTEFLAASSVGQTLALLGLTATPEQRLIAAADHCLASAYRGLCPGIAPEALRSWRVRVMAAHQGRSEEEIRTSIVNAETALRDADEITVGVSRFRDMRGTFVPQLPEAATYLGVAYVAEVTEGRRRKVVASSPRSSDIEDFFRHAEALFGTTALYGDPARGFAGSYLRR